MSDTATDATPQQTQETPPPAPEQVVQPQGDGDPDPLNIEDDAAVDAALAENAITVPGDDGLVPMSETGRMARAYRDKIKGLKADLASAQTSASEAATLKQQIAQLQTQVQQLSPYVNAYQAMQQAAQQAAPNAEEDAEAEEYAKLLDLYTGDGKPDIGRAKKGLALVKNLAAQAAQQHVAPLQQQTVGQQSSYNLARAKNTTLPNGQKVDPAMLDLVWKQLDPSLTATREGALQALVAAAGYGVLASQPQQQVQQQAQQRAANGQFATGEQLPPPLVTERAGGRTTAADAELSAADKAYIKSAGISEKEFRESASKAPWLKRG